MAAVLTMVLAGLMGSAAPVQAATPTTYQGHVYPVAAGAASADKPQSKLWYNAAASSWSALMVNAVGTVNIFELQDDHTWRDTGTVVDERTKSTGDALWSGGKLYVVSRTGGSAGAVRVYRFSYSTLTRTYSRDGDPFTFGGSGTESATIDKDSTGRLWVTFTRGKRVWVAHTTNAEQTAWTSPFRISGADTAVSGDDISAVIAFRTKAGVNKIGVLWSDQASNAIRFAHHVDGAPDSSWTVETPLAGSGLADDHLNIKSLQGDDEGRLYAAVKTSNTTSTDPLLLVLTRTDAGSWSAAPTATVADGLTRPQIALDKTNRVVYVLQSTEGGGTVYYKTAPLSDTPSFGPGKGAAFITWKNASISNVSTTKDPVTATTGLVAIASDESAHRYYHAELALDGTGGTEESTGGGTEEPIGGGTEEPAGGGTAVTVTVPATADSYVDSGSAGSNYGTSTRLDVDGSPVRISYLKFDLSAYAGRTVNSATLRLRVTTNGSTGTQRIKLVSDDGWTETGVTYSNRPALGAVLGSLGPTSTETSYDVALSASDIAGQLGGELSLGMDSGSSNGVDLASRETGSTAPTLLLTLAP